MHAACRYQFKTNPEQFYGLRYPYSPVAHNGKRSAHSTGLKSGPKSDRAYRVIAGPGDLDPANLWNLPANAAATRTGRAGPVLITRGTPPVNIVGGCKFPGAPVIDLLEKDFNG